MAITTYSELTQAVANWLNRSDLTAVIPDFVVLAEAQIRRKLRRALHTEVELTVVTGDVVLTSALDSVESLALRDGAGGTYNHPLDLIDFKQYQSLMSQDPTVRAPTEAAYPEYNADGTLTLHFYPPVSASAPIATLIVAGEQKLPDLATNSTNAVLRDAPDIYLYATLLEAAPYLEYEERIPIWEARLEKGVREYEAFIERRRFGAPFRAQLPHVF